MIRSNIPFVQPPLVHCITNGITNQFVTNVLHACGAKAIMVEDQREIEHVVQISDAVLLNLGQLTPYKEEGIRLAMAKAALYKKPVVIDIVGITASHIRHQLTLDLLKQAPQVLKGNVSEMRCLCQLHTNAKGVDSIADDQQEDALQLLIQAMKQLACAYPQTTFVATGVRDIIIHHNNTIVLQNGVPQLDAFSGSGDAVGAIIAACLSVTQPTEQACMEAISYFNICGEHATSEQGIGTFVVDLINQLDKRKETNWTSQIRG